MNNFFHNQFDIGAEWKNMVAGFSNHSGMLLGFTFIGTMQLPIIAIIVVVVLGAGLYIGVSYWQAFQRRKELARRGRIQPPKDESKTPGSK